MLIYLSMIETPEDRSKFERIYENYRQLMFYIANSVLKDTRDAEDVVHEAFLKMIEILDQIEDASSPRTKALAATITERKAIDLYRRKRRKTFLPLDEGLADVSGPSKETAADHVIAEAIAALPANYREVLILKYAHGFTMEEVGGLLSMSTESVKKTIQRARKKLESVLKEEALL